MAGFIFGLIRRAIAPIACLFLSHAFAANDLAYLEGAWTPITGPNIGAPFWFNKAFAGYDAFIPWWGQTSVAQSSKFGSHIKIEGKKNDQNASCFYYVTKLSRARMAWNLRNGDNSNCPESLLFEKRESQSAEEATEKGRKHAQNKDYDLAIAEYNEAIRIDSSYAPAWAARGFSRQQKGDHAAAIDDYSEAIRLNPSSALYYFDRGASYKLKGDDQAAIANYSDAIRLNMKDGAVYYNRGMAYVSQNNFKHAARDFAECLGLSAADGVHDNARSMLEHVKRELALVQLTVCNRLDEGITVTVLGYHESDASQLLTLNIDLMAQQCEDLKRFERAKGIWMIVDGESSKQRWRAEKDDTSAARLCLDRHGIYQPAYRTGSCPTNTTIVRFFKQIIDSEALTHTSHLP